LSSTTAEGNADDTLEAEDELELDAAEFDEELAGVVGQDEDI
jgi:hypothetical protein